MLLVDRNGGRGVARVAQFIGGIWASFPHYRHVGASQTFGAGSLLMKSWKPTD